MSETSRPFTIEYCWNCGSNDVRFAKNDRGVRVVCPCGTASKIRATAEKALREWNGVAQCMLNKRGFYDTRRGVR